MEFAISEEQRLVAETTRDFARAVIEPHVREWDEAQAFPDEVMGQIAALGFLGGVVPEEYGGAGLSTLEYVTMVEEMARIDPAVALSVAAHNSLCTGHVLLAGNEDQKKRYLPRLASGEWIGAWGLTEPQAGSDAAGTRATAVWNEAGGHWVLNGNKTFNTNGARAQLAVVHAVTKQETLSMLLTHDQAFDQDGNSRCIHLLDTLKIHYQLRAVRSVHLMKNRFPELRSFFITDPATDGDHQHSGHVRRGHTFHLKRC